MINVTVGEQKPQQAKPFPKLMTLTKLKGVFLFYDESCCTCICEPNEAHHWKIGEHQTGVIYGAFEDYNEPITLQNA